jgi:hypothetical protein
MVVCFNPKGDIERYARCTPLPFRCRISVLFHRIRMNLRAGPVFLAFLAMGFVDAIGPFMSLAKKKFLLRSKVQ